MTYQSMKAAERIGALSLKKYVSGNPVTSISKPVNLNVQAVPRFSTIADMDKLITAPPNPPAAKMIPLAKPRRRLKY